MADLPDNATVIVQDPAGLQARATLRPPLVSGWPHTLLFPTSLNGPLNGILTPDTVNSRLTLASPYELVIPAGTAAIPSLGFSGDLTTGVYLASPGRVAITSAGQFTFRMHRTGTESYFVGPDGGAALVMVTDGSVRLGSAGTNQSITLIPSGTGNVVVANSNGQGINFTGANAKLDAGANRLRIFSTPLEINSSGGNVLLGTSTDSSNGRLQLATHTTAAGGIGFGTDTALHRENAGALALFHATNPRLLFSENGTITGSLQASAASVLLSANSSLVLRTGGSTTALTLDTSQNATFAGAIVSGGNVTIPAANVLLWTGRTRLWSDSDGTLRLQNAAGTDFSRLLFGGTTASFPALKRNATQLEVRLADDSAFAGVQASIIGINGQSYMDSAASGVVSIRNSAGTDFGRLQFGGTTASFPALKRAGTTIQSRLADDSGWANFQGALFIANSAASSAGAGTVTYGGTTASTVGAAGGASALPATPLGYIIVNVAGTTAKIPYYNN